MTLARKPPTGTVGAGPFEKMSPEELALWRSARTLGDLGELTARWLEGTIKSQPGYAVSVDVDEKDAPGLTETLALLCRAGYVTTSSQAGSAPSPGYDKAIWAQRAAVDGWVDLCGAPGCERSDIDWLKAAVAGTRFKLHKSRDGITVTTRKGKRYTHFGHGGSAAGIAEYIGLPREAIATIGRSVEVAVYDPRYGPNDLWPVLRVAAQEQIKKGRT